MGYEQFNIDLILNHRPQRCWCPKPSLLHGMMHEAGVDDTETAVTPAGNIEGDIPCDPAIEMAMTLKAPFFLTIWAFVGFNLSDKYLDLLRPLL